MFLQVSVCPHGGACVVARGGIVVALGGMHGCSRGGMCGCLGGMCGCSRGDMHGCSQGDVCGCSRGACMVALGGMCGCSQGAGMVALGGVHGCSQGVHGYSRGACMVAVGGMRGCSWGGHAWDTTRYGDMINERAVRILLECILVLFPFGYQGNGVKVKLSYCTLISLTWFYSVETCSK